MRAIKDFSDDSLKYLRNQAIISYGNKRNMSRLRDLYYDDEVYMLSLIPKLIAEIIYLRQVIKKDSIIDKVSKLLYNVVNKYDYEEEDIIEVIKIIQQVKEL